MHWYTLSPFDDLKFQGAKALTASRASWISADMLLPGGRAIAAALRTLLQNAMVTLRGPFFCYEERLYFPYPLNHSAAQPLVPVTWLPSSLDESGNDQALLWDRRKPAPLQTSHSAKPTSLEQHNRHFLPYEAVLQRLTSPPTDLGNLAEPQPWSVETQLRIPSSGADFYGQDCSVVEKVIRLNPGWKLAIAVDDTTHRKLRYLGNTLLIELGEENHQFWLEAQDEPFKQQWQSLQKQSAQNRKTAEQALQEKQAEGSRILAYLVTPGVFERKHDEVATCRNFPWEWDLAYPADQNQTPGPLVSVATAKPISIRYRGLSKVGALALQVFAVPAGSVYYLEYPADLFQDQPLLKDSRPNKVHIWRQLGYSEILWMPYGLCPEPAS